MAITKINMNIRQEWTKEYTEEYVHKKNKVLISDDLI